jgi:predicted O-methyltransferase YrrM
MTQTAYDRRAYPSSVRPLTHPLRLGAMARMCGRAAAAFENCRVLEVGGGDGINVIAMAEAAPNSTFLSFDLAETPVRRGQDIVKSLGLQNVRVEAMDLCAFPESEGQFDYIIAHGVYAWVPDFVREGLMRLCAQALSAQGVAFISYNALPGGRVRAALRDLLLRATAGITDPELRSRKARETLLFYLSKWDETEAIPVAFHREAERMMKLPDGVIFHDEMGDIYAPQHVSDVIAAGQAAGLDYLCDAQVSLALDGWLPGENFDSARSMTDGNFLRWEQVRDVIDGRSFRQSLFCKQAAPMERAFVPARLSGLWASGTFAHEVEKEQGRSVHVFRPPTGGKMRTNSATLAEALMAISATYPSALPLERFAEDADLLRALTQLWASSAIEVTTGPFCCATDVSQKPLASLLARHGLAMGDAQLATLRHTHTALADEPSRAFLRLLDGTRTIEEIADAMAQSAAASKDEALRSVHAGLRAFVEMGLLRI